MDLQVEFVFSFEQHCSKKLFRALMKQLLITGLIKVVIVQYGIEN